MADLADLPTPQELTDLASELDDRDPEGILKWAIATYRPRLVLSCSLGGPGGMVIADLLLRRLDADVPVAYIDTDLLFDETYAFIETFVARYGVQPIAIRSELSLDQQREQNGEALWARDPSRCCAIRKVEPQRKFLANYDAWITGIRRDQSPTRARTPVAQWDTVFGLGKINPLAAWSERDVWAYVAEHKVPTNPLLARGYASIGCIPCTRTVLEGEDARAGRWSGFAKTECGLHLAAGAR